MQIYIFVNVIKKAEPRYNVSLYTKCYTKYCTSDILHIFPYYT